MMVRGVLRDAEGGKAESSPAERATEDGAGGGAGGGAAAIDTEGEEVRLAADATRIDVDLPGMRSFDDGEFVAFGAYRENGDGMVLQKPEDPMAELILMAGDPGEIAAGCARLALRWEIVSALFIFLDLAVNVPLLFFLLSLLMR
jgi:hypothetical protein